MDRFAAMVLLLGGLISMILVVVSLFCLAPVVCACLASLAYTLYLFIAYEDTHFAHGAQEFENRFWTLFAVLTTIALLFASDSPVAYGLNHPSLALLTVILSGYLMHLWDRCTHRDVLLHSQKRHDVVFADSFVRKSMKNSPSSSSPVSSTNEDDDAHPSSSSSSLDQLHRWNIPVEDFIQKINDCLAEIDQLLIPSTINNFINHRFVLTKEREIITVFEQVANWGCSSNGDGGKEDDDNDDDDEQQSQQSKEMATVALNYLVRHVKLGLCFYKIKDHRHFHGKHRTELCHLLAVEKLDMLNVVSRVILLHSLQLLKLRANPQAEYWVRNILLETNGDDLSNLKTLTDGKGDYFCMNKLIFDDIRSETTRQDILRHIRRQAAAIMLQQQQQQQQKHREHETTTTTTTSSAIPVSKRGRIMLHRHDSSQHQVVPHLRQRRKVLSDVDDTLYCSGGMYPAGVDKRFSRKVVYPGVLAFYRELDVGTRGPPEWNSSLVGNLVFLSARPHVYKDMSEKANYAKFEKLMKPPAPSSSGNNLESPSKKKKNDNNKNSNNQIDDGRKGMHTMPSLLPGDLASGSHYIVRNDFEPLARKKFDNFCRYVSIYPEFRHVFVCDNGQGDVRAGEMMFDGFPYEFEALYVHNVLPDRNKTYGFHPQRWRQKHFAPFFFNTYPEAALHAATRSPPMIRVEGLQRICAESVKDFMSIEQWPSEFVKSERRLELNQAIWRANLFLSQVAEAQWQAQLEQEESDLNDDGGGTIAPVALIPAERKWLDNQKVTTPYGRGIVRGFDAEMDLYSIDLDWRPLDVQVLAHAKDVELEKQQQKKQNESKSKSDGKRLAVATTALETVHETDEGEDETEKKSTTSETVSKNSKEGVDAAGTASAEEQLGALAVTRAGDDTATTEVVDDAVTQTVGEPSAERALESNSSTNASVTPGLTDDESSLGTSCSDNGSTDNVDAESSSITASVDKSSAAAAEESDKKENDTDTLSKDDTIETRSRVRVSVSGRFVTKYTPPVLPKLTDKQHGASIFDFLSSSPQVAAETKKPFQEGDQYDSPYGPVKVIEYRQKKGIVVVKMLGWNATGYLSEATLKPIPKSLLASFLSRMTATTSASEVPSRPNHPFAEGTKIVTAFGRGTLTRAVFAPPKPSGPPSESTKRSPTKSKPPATATATTTVAIRLDSWTLANGAHPMLYCTPEAAKTWKERNTEDGTSFFSALGTLVTSSRTLLEPFLAQQQKQDAVVTKPTFERYYQDAAAVTTPYGDGVVRTFRESDGVYEVDLIGWTLANGKHPKAFLRKDDINYRIAKGCQEGYPVLTSLGMSGRLASVEPKTGVHIVMVPSAGMVCYLQPECVVRPLKAAVGEDVSTAYGEGKVLRYNKEQDVYCIKLSGWNAILYAKGDTFEPVGDGVQDRDGPFGVNWLLRFLFSSSASNGGAGAAASTGSRSRSNSVSGASNRSVAGTRTRSNSIVSGS